jgi:hypothetical protein
VLLRRKSALLLSHPLSFLFATPLILRNMWLSSTFVILSSFIVSAATHRSHPKRHDTGPSQTKCDSVRSFCNDFIDKCIASCANVHHPKGFHGKTAVQYKCEYNGWDYYGRPLYPLLCFRLLILLFTVSFVGIGCICGSEDLTSDVLSEIGSSSTRGKDHTITVTKTSTSTHTTTAHALETATVTRTSTKVVATTGKVTVTRTRTVGKAGTITDIFTTTVVRPTTVTDYTTLLDIDTVTDLQTELDTETDTSTSTIHSTEFIPLTLVTTETETVLETTPTTEIDFTTETETETDYTSTTSTAVATITSLVGPFTTSVRSILFRLIFLRSS